MDTKKPSCKILYLKGPKLLRELTIRELLASNISET